MDGSARRGGVSEQERRSVLERLWLTYYNDTLYAKGLITEDERNRMRIKIKNRAPGPDTH